MKNYKYYILFFCILIPFLAFSQRQMFHSKKWKLDGGVGLANSGFNGIVAVGLHNEYDTRQWARVSLEYLSSKITGKDIENFHRDINLPVDLYTLNITYNTTLLQVPSYRRVLNMNAYFALDVGLGSVIGYEMVNDGAYELETGEAILDRSKMVYGAVGRVDLEMFLGIPNMCTFIEANQKYLVNSDIGNMRFTVNFGLRVWLNN